MNSDLKLKQKIALGAFGLITLCFGLGAIVNSFYVGNPELIFWICYSCMILIGIGLLAKSSDLILIETNILAIPLIWWNADFFYRLISGKTLFGTTDYLFINGNILGKIISLQHTFTLIFCLYGLYILRTEKSKKWILGIIQVFLVFILTRIFTSPDSNINCVFKPCLNITLNHYTLFWLSGFFAMIFLSNLILSRMFRKKTINKPRHSQNAPGRI